MKHGFRAMRPGGNAGAGGAIVNIASVAATIAFPAIAGYSGTKSAVNRMTLVAAKEAGKLGYGVCANCLQPAVIPPNKSSRLHTNHVAPIPVPALRPAPRPAARPRHPSP